MILLPDATSILTLQSSLATPLDVVASWVDAPTSLGATTVPSSSLPQAITGTSVTTVVASPAAFYSRLVKYLSVVNTSSTLATTITIRQVNAASVAFVVFTATLQPGETFRWNAGGEPTISAPNGLVYVPQARPIDGFSRFAMKVGTAAEAIGQLHSLALAPGSLGAWAPGTPGLAGRATDGTTVADNGCFPVPTPATGSTFLTALDVQSTVAQGFQLVDLMWVNSGITVTIATAQTITSVAWPSRSDDGTTLGAGVRAGVLVSVATTNAGAVVATISYTNSAGTAGRTGTLTIPATAVVGWTGFFTMQAGDSGVRSIQTLTLAATLTAGTIHLTAGVVKLLQGVPLANSGIVQNRAPGGVRLYPGVCLLPQYLATAVTATTAYLTPTFEVR